MRRLVAIVGIASLWACSVPDKQPLTGDGGVDTQGGMTGGIPDTTITSAPHEFSNSSAATFEFAATTTDARFTCSFDGEPPVSCTSPAVRTLADGTHSFSVRAIAPDGKSDDTPAEHLWTVDTVAPITTITEAPPANDNSVMVHFSFISNEMNTTFECSLDSSEYESCRSGDQFGPITDGTHSFAVRAADRAKNVDASPAIHTWFVDTSTPDTTLLSGPVGSTGESIATFTFESPDAGPGATFECSLDGSPFAACVSPTTYSNLPMAVHTFAVRVRDVNGNVDPTPATRTWTIDLTPPETTITRGPTGTVAMASASISFTSNEMDVTFACSLDGAAASACTSPYNVTMLAQGPHTFSVAATDMAGHTDPTPATASWTVDTAAPALAITGGPDDGSTVGPRVSFTFTTSEGNTQCRLDAETTWRACTSPFSFNAPDGAHTFYLRATDSSGNTMEIQRAWTVACAPPDPAGAVGLLHLEDNAQTLANATGGPGATLGSTDQAETDDPNFATARFGMGLAFSASEGDTVGWPLMGGPSGTFTLSAWVDPAASAANILASGDGRIELGVAAADASTTIVRFSATLIDSGGTAHTVTSAKSYPVNTWHQVVASLAEPTLRLWVDGDRTEINDARAGTAASLDAVNIGGVLQATLDEIWIGKGATTSDGDVLAGYCPLGAIRY